MKVAVTGKGGVGKTTLSSTLARLYADEGRTVLAADVDPDANLGLALGLTQEEVNAIVPVSKMRELVMERTAANESNTFYKLNPQVSDLPDKLAKDINGVKLLVMGTVDTGGTGCVCPEHVMIKRLTGLICTLLLLLATSASAERTVTIEDIMKNAFTLYRTLQEDNYPRELQNTCKVHGKLCQNKAYNGLFPLYQLYV